MPIASKTVAQTHFLFRNPGHRMAYLTLIFIYLYCSYLTKTCIISNSLTAFSGVKAIEIAFCSQLLMSPSHSCTSTVHSSFWDPSIWRYKEPGIFIHGIISNNERYYNIFLNWENIFLVDFKVNILFFSMHPIQYLNNLNIKVQT